ncbi:hypothetical protein B0H13DRAFT_2277262 [Mycena leptocephala]|nr:hypothetical protein B0H13DRAFT_2277262 [Mycena leptocephala]
MAAKKQTSILPFRQSASPPDSATALASHGGDQELPLQASHGRPTSNFQGLEIKVKEEGQPMSTAPSLFLRPAPNNELILCQQPPCRSSSSSLRPPSSSSLARQQHLDVVINAERWGYTVRWFRVVSRSGRAGRSIARRAEAKFIQRQHPIPSSPATPARVYASPPLCLSSASPPPPPPPSSSSYIILVNEAVAAASQITTLPWLHILQTAVAPQRRRTSRLTTHDRGEYSISRWVGNSARILSTIIHIWQCAGGPYALSLVDGDAHAGAPVGCGAECILIHTSIRTTRAPRARGIKRRRSLLAACSAAPSSTASSPSFSRAPPSSVSLPLSALLSSFVSRERTRRAPRFPARPLLAASASPSTPRRETWSNEPVNVDGRQQTETASIVITPFSGAVRVPTKPESACATVPFLGHVPAILDLITIGSGDYLLNWEMCGECKRYPKSHDAWTTQQIAFDGTGGPWLPEMPDTHLEHAFQWVANNRRGRMMFTLVKAQPKFDQEAQSGRRKRVFIGRPLEL